MRSRMLVALSVVVLFALVPALAGARAGDDRQRPTGGLGAQDRPDRGPLGADGSRVERPQRGQGAGAQGAGSGFRGEGRPQRGQGAGFQGAGSGFRGEGPLRGRGRGLNTSCTVSTIGMFDPIVFPGQSGVGHMHVFFGNTTIDPDSTPASLRAANADGTATTCRNRRDGSAYWVPQLLADGVAVDPVSVVARYRPARGAERATFPLDFQVIAGSSRATEQQPGIGFRCLERGASRRLSVTPPTCSDGAMLAGVVRFETCWDGTNASSSDQSHVAGRVAGECPATHPISIPSLELTVRYPADGLDHDWTLASGSTVGYHADFVNGWDPRSLRRLAGRAPRG